MTILINILIIISCIFGLWFGAVWIVDSASKIAKKFGMSDLVIGLTIVAIATSAPEFAVTITAAIKGQSAISVGNVVGSNIFNLGIILSLLTFFSVIKISKLILYRDGAALFAATILLGIFFLDRSLSSSEGIILIFALVFYVVFLIVKKYPAEADELESLKDDLKWYDILKLILGAPVIVASAHFFVNASSDIARLIGVSEWLIGVTIVAAGTSAPELATSIVAIIKGKHGISVGNLIGSDIFNLLGVLGLASVFKTLPLNDHEFASILLMISSVFILLILMRRKWRLTKLEGGLILLIALLRWGFDFID